MKLSKQELKTPDQIWLASRSALSWATERWTVLGSILGVFFIVTVAGVYIYQMKKNSEAKAQYEWGLAKSYLEQWKLETGETKVKAEADLKKSLDVLQKDYSSSKANRMAGLFRGQLAAAANDWAEAAKDYEIYAGALSSTDKPLAWYPLGVVYEQLGQDDKALDAYSKILNVKGSFYEELALLGKARSLKHLQKTNEAIEQYKLFLEKFPASQEVPYVRSQLAVLQTAVK